MLFLVPYQAYPSHSPYRQQQELVAVSNHPCVTLPNERPIYRLQEDSLLTPLPHRLARFMVRDKEQQQEDSHRHQARDPCE